MQWKYNCDNLVGPRAPGSGRWREHPSGLPVLREWVYHSEYYVWLEREDGLALRVGPGGWMLPEDCPSCPPNYEEDSAVKEALKLWAEGCCGGNLARVLMDYLAGQSDLDLAGEVAGFWKANAIAAGIEAMRCDD